MGFSNRCRDGVGFSTGSSDFGAEIFARTNKLRFIIRTKILRFTALPSFGWTKVQPSVVVGGVDSQA